MNYPTLPVAGKDYPRTYQEFLTWFPDEMACRQYLARCRWPHGFVCLHCGDHSAPWLTSRGYRHCRRCEHEVSIIAGTIFERTRLPLTTWFATIWFVTSQKDGASALGLQRVLGLSSYHTAWTCLQKLRCAMVRPDRDQLQGHIEVDETYMGGQDVGGKRGRGSGGKQIVVIAVEVQEPKGFGRVRMRQIVDVSGDSLIPFICDVAEPGALILTDGWKGYNSLSQRGFGHEKRVISDTGDPAHISMPGVHRVAALVKRWLMSTHQGAVSGKYLEYYLDEYTFRFNRRNSRSRGMLFYRLIEQAVSTAPMPYKQIIQGTTTGSGHLR